MEQVELLTGGVISQGHIEIPAGLRSMGGRTFVMTPSRLSRPASRRASVLSTAFVEEFHRLLLERPNLPKTALAKSALAIHPDGKRLRLHFLDERSMCQALLQRHRAKHFDSHPQIWKLRGTRQGVKA
ncbi:hypothetical protein KBY88_03885 [Cyanobium sp. Morenito 9A2]|nr:hypothetical protein [Cyanobium sp. Morenito 9A2]